ncbi:hypothetical protein Tco_0795337 [Tanacetum coccineum]
MVVEVAAAVWRVVMMMMMYGVDDRFGGDVDDGGGWRGSAGVAGRGSQTGCGGSIVAAAAAVFGGGDGGDQWRWVAARGIIDRVSGKTEKLSGISFYIKLL